VELLVLQEQMDQVLHLVQQEQQVQIQQQVLMVNQVLQEFQVG
jgi:hypothetical protein|tara:strand:- start:434 stop:562 length:129 start_codon:yes stop_codon:yes gene_type:complete